MTDPMDGIGEIDEGTSRDQSRRGMPAAILAIFIVCLAVELVLSGADFGLWGNPRWRAIGLAYGAFWPGLLGNWPRNFLLQPVTMFASYGFLHAGLFHFVVNMATLFSLGPPIADRIGQARFLLLYVLAIIGGAVGFALLAHGTIPMVGASGALFGLAGALLSWELSDRLAQRLSLTPVVRALAMLVGLNLVLWWAMNGQLAWETHLGGFVTGWLFARLPVARRAQG